jgi:hypothetical protein
MSQLLTDLQICNMALANISVKQIATLDATAATYDNSKAALLCRTYLAPSKNSVLQESNWRFARCVQALVPTTDVGPTAGVLLAFPGWAYVFNFPMQDLSTDLNCCLFIRKVFSDIVSVNPAAIEFKEFFDPVTNKKNYICTNEETCYVEYTYYGSGADGDATVGQNTNSYDPLFVEALSYYLAAKMAFQLTGDAKIAEGMSQLYQNVIAKARLADAQEEYVKVVPTSSILESR